MALSYSTNSDMITVIRGVWHVVYYDGDKTKLHNTRMPEFTERWRVRKARDKFYDKLKTQGAVDRSSPTAKIDRNPDYAIVEQPRYLVRIKGKNVFGSNVIEEARAFRDKFLLNGFGKISTNNSKKL